MAELVEEGLTFAREGTHVRATCDDGRSYLFLEEGLEGLIEAYRRAASSVRERLGPRFDSFGGDKLDDESFRAMTREAALDFLYVAVINGLSREPEENEWEHPTTHRVVERWVARAFRRRPEHARALAAHLMGLSLEQYDAFKAAEARYANR